MPVVMRRRQRQLRKAKLVVLCDVSRSMEPFVRLLLRYVVELSRQAALVEAFVFSTNITRITPLLRRRGLAAMAAITAASVDWSGGTTIGACLHRFVRHHAGRTVDRDTVVVILSDGLDTGDPALVASALAQLRRRARLLVWLNPLAASPGFRPATRAMVHALPYLDVLSSAHSVEALNQLASQFMELSAHRAHQARRRVGRRLTS